MGIFQSLTNLDTWRSKRADAMHSARACRKTLTNPAGHWAYSPDDERVLAAVGSWVKRARRAHAIVMQREPIIDNFVAITSQGVQKGPLYAGEKQCLN